MKVSKEHKEQVRKLIIESAVDVISIRGYRGATMREISKSAELGASTIYNYFSTKEKIVIAYFEDKQEEIEKSIAEIPDFESFSLKEKIQTRLETSFDIYQGEREFINIIIKRFFRSNPLTTYKEMKPFKKIFVEEMNHYLDASVENNEIAEPMLRNHIPKLLWDYYKIIFYYWVKDKSQDFNNSSRVVDLSLDIIIEMMENKILPRTLDLGYFLLRTHLFDNVEGFEDYLSPLKKMGDKIKKFKSEIFKDEE